MSFSLRPITEADFGRIVRILNQDSPEPISMEEYARQYHHHDPSRLVTRLVAVVEPGEIVAYGFTATSSGHKPGHFALRVRVDRAHRGRGYGLALYASLEGWAISRGAAQLDSSVLEADSGSLAWAERRGWVKDLHIFTSILNLPDWDPAPFLESVAQAEASGIRFSSLGDLGATEEGFRRLHRFGYEVSQDIPGNSGSPEIDFKQWLPWIQEDPHFDPAGVVVALDGDRWAAMAHVKPMHSGGWDNTLSGVAREYRGRGLALATKVVALQYAKGQGAPYLRTWNHSNNQPMLAVNRKLGYVPEPGVFTVIKRVSG